MNSRSKVGIYQYLIERVWRRKAGPSGRGRAAYHDGSSPTERTIILDFVVVDEEGPYQMIVGRPFLRMSKAVLSNHYLALKYRVNGVVGVVR